MNVAQVLLEFGADREAKTHDGTTPADVAAQLNFLDVVGLLRHGPAKRPRSA